MKDGAGPNRPLSCADVNERIIAKSLVDGRLVTKCRPVSADFNGEPPMMIVVGMGV